MVAVQVPTIITKPPMVVSFGRSLNTMIDDMFDQYWLELLKGGFTSIRFYNGDEKLDEYTTWPLYFKNYVN